MGFFKPYLLDLKTPFLAFSRDVLPPKKKLCTIKVIKQKWKFQILVKFWFFSNIFFQNFHFLSWNDIFAIRNWILILYSLWKLHFWGFPEIQKRNLWFDIFISWKKWFFSFCLTTLMVHNFLLVAEYLWKTPEMEFSDRVDIV